ncbi:MAG: DUF2238 domain-containing protein [archaeon]
MKKGLKYTVAITLLVLIGFLVKALLAKNFEFIGYWIVLVALFLVVVKLDKKYNFPLPAIWFFSIWSMLHMAGGLLKINGTRLYDTILIPLIGEPFSILKFDQVIHIYCYFAIAILSYFIVKKYIPNKTALIYISILVAFAVGGLNEIIEFGMVVFANAGAAVGGYYNNALDLVCNLIGAIAGTLLARKVWN